MPLLAEEEEGVIRKPAVKGRMFDELGHEPVKSADIRVHEAIQKVSESFGELTTLRRQVDLLLLEAKEKGYLNEIDTETSVRKVPRPRHKRPAEINIEDKANHRPDAESLSLQEIRTGVHDTLRTVRIRVAEERMVRDRAFDAERFGIECSLLADAWINAVERLARSIGNTEGRTDVSMEFNSQLNGETSITIDGRRCVFTFNIVTGNVWNEYWEARGQSGLDNVGVTLGRKEIFIPHCLINNGILLNDAILHEIWHVLSLFDSPSLREGIADIDAYRRIQISADIPSDVKNKLSMVYREEAAISYLVEQIVGSDFYYYCHAKGGEMLLSAKFDHISKGTRYDDIFGREVAIVGGRQELVDTVDNLDKLKVLSGIFLKVENDPRIRQIIDENTGMIKDHGKLDLEKQEEAETIRRKRRLPV